MGIPAKFLIKTKEAIAEPMAKMLRKSLDEVKIPDIRKMAYVSPIHKVQSVRDCAQICDDIEKCNGFHYYGKTDDPSYTHSNGDCYLKTEVTKVTTNLGDGRERYGGLCSRKGNL